MNIKYTHEINIDGTLVLDKKEFAELIKEYEYAEDHDMLEEAKEFMLEQVEDEISNKINIDYPIIDFEEKEDEYELYFSYTQEIEENEII